ncbi:MAG: GDP-mannose 4,6-dehydratase [Calothrix sp. FI2-JRJ7]|nr:GDP-mannose 4,6-dehydratase [Calothrix sp. FI2-JRJ7]
MLFKGITGQDGSYSSEQLLEKGYEVDGIIRKTSTFNTDRINHFYNGSHNKDAHYLQPVEVDLLIFDETKAKQNLSWKPSVSLEQLVKLKIKADLQANGLSLPNQEGLSSAFDNSQALENFS